MPGLRKGGVVGDVALEAEQAESAVVDGQMHFFAQAPAPRRSQRNRERMLSLVAMINKL